MDKVGDDGNHPGLNRDMALGQIRPFPKQGKYLETRAVTEDVAMGPWESLYWCYSIKTCLKIHVFWVDRSPCNNGMEGRYGGANIITWQGYVWHNFHLWYSKSDTKCIYTLTNSHREP